MNTVTLQQALDDIFDQAIVYHAFTDYLRDYEVIVDATAPRAGARPLHLRYLFRYCVEAQVQTAVSAEVWCRSLDDRLVEQGVAAELDGFVWGVRWQALYPGADVVPDSERARRWADRLGIDFHEIRIETNGHTITLVFSELQVTELPAGYAPFVTSDDTG